jgi:hypothetical protein
MIFIRFKSRDEIQISGLDEDFCTPRTDEYLRADRTDRRRAARTAMDGIKLAALQFHIAIYIHLAGQTVGRLSPWPNVVSRRIRRARRFPRVRASIARASAGMHVTQSVLPRCSTRFLSLMSPIVFPHAPCVRRG